MDKSAVSLNAYVRELHLVLIAKTPYCKNDACHMKNKNYASNADLQQ